MSFLKDPWQIRQIPLDGFVERHRFAPWFMAMIVLLVALVAFQLIFAPLTIISIILTRDTGPGGLVEELLAVMEGEPQVLLIANTIGQFLGLALPVFLFTRLSTPSVLNFLRVRRTSLPLLGLSIVGLAALIPIVDVAGSINESLPWPESIREFERLMMEPIEAYLSDPGNLLPGILMISLTPALCEELLFRGYVQRQAERSMGTKWGILFTGLIFGAYHLQLTKVLPLSLLGLYLAYITWRTGSVWPAIIVHFANNAFAVILSMFYLKDGVENFQNIEELDLPFYFVVGGMVVFACSVYLIDSLSRSRMELVQEDFQTGDDPEADHEKVT